MKTKNSYISFSNRRGHNNFRRRVLRLNIFGLAVSSSNFMNVYRTYLIVIPPNRAIKDNFIKIKWHKKTFDVVGEIASVEEKWALCWAYV